MDPRIAGIDKGGNEVYRSNGIYSEISEADKKALNCDHVWKFNDSISRYACPHCGYGNAGRKRAIELLVK